MKFLRGNEWQWRLLRTVCQGVIGVAVANAGEIIGWFNFPDAAKPVIVALCMAVLSPIMAEIGRANEEKTKTDDIPLPAEEPKE